MQTFSRWYFKALEVVLVLCLAAMCVMVFGNVVLRHFFNSGINVSEELSRFMFIWMTFIGATLAMRDGGHLGMDMVVRSLSGRVQFAVVLLGQCVVLACCVIMFWGLLRQHAFNVTNIGLVTGISLAAVYSVAYLCAASIGAMTILRIVQLLRGKTSATALVHAANFD
jgi:TRAP-type transport system small permease protein